MNFFLLAAVPLFAVVLHRLLTPQRPVFAEPKTWILGSVWSLLALIAVAPLGKLREFNGSLLDASLGLLITDALLVPGVVIAAWVLTRKGHDQWDLGLWLALAFGFAGVRDFVATSGVYDLNEFFLVPLDRLLLLVLLPSTIVAALGATSVRQVLWILAAVVLVLTGPTFQVFSFAGWGWTVWLLEATGLGLGLWWQKKTTLTEGGSVEPVAQI